MSHTLFFSKKQLVTTLIKHDREITHTIICSFDEIRGNDFKFV